MSSSNWIPSLSVLTLPRYRFNLPTSNSVLGLPIGQHISIGAMLPGQPKEVVRSYTPISSDENRGYFDLLIKSYPTGNISKHVATLQAGQTLKVKGPKGAMMYTPNMVRRLGMIAGGTGITPMLQIIRAIVRGRPRNGGTDRTEVDLIFANVNEEDILLKEDLDTLAKEDESFRVHYVLNNPPGKWDGGVGFVTADIIKVCDSPFSHLTELILFLGQPTSSGERHQGVDLRTPPHGQRYEESDRIAGVRKGKSAQQTT